MNIWLDDEREPPAGWEWYKTAEPVIRQLLEAPGEVEAISLDNDLGACELEGHYVAKFLFILSQVEDLRGIDLQVHTQNAVARERIEWYYSVIRRGQGRVVLNEQEPGPQ